MPRPVILIVCIDAIGRSLNLWGYCYKILSILPIARGIKTVSKSSPIEPYKILNNSGVMPQLPRVKFVAGVISSTLSVCIKTGAESSNRNRAGVR